MTDVIADAVAILRAGGLVAFPTETVYGLGADARNPEAIRRLFAAKGRPADHPVIVHLANADEMHDWASHVPPAARTLADAFWPGPLTLVLPRAGHVLDLVTGGQETVALRVPSHPVAHALLAAFGDGIVAPSANRFGRLSPTRAEHVRADLGNAVGLILDGGPTDVGVESTIVDLSGDRPVLLRPGGISPAQLASVLGAPPDAPHAASPRASGTLPSHYAPHTPLEIVKSDDVTERLTQLQRPDGRIAVVSWSEVATFGSHPPVLGPDNEWTDYFTQVIERPLVVEPPFILFWMHAPHKALHYAQHLYEMLRELDSYHASRILVEEVPDGDAWLAVRDRLRRAAYRGEEK